MPKNKLKINSKYLDKLGSDVTADELPSDACIKRVNFDSTSTLASPLSYNSDIDVVEPHIMGNKDEFSVGIITTIDVDSDGDVILPLGVDTSRYEKNPVVLFQHNLNMPIGFAEEINITEDKIVAKTRYGSTEEAKKIHQLLKDKVLRTHSIGFVALESVIRGTKDFEIILNELKSKFPNKFDEETSQRVDRVVTKSLLLEYSIVTIPANEEAVINEIKNIKDNKKVTKEITEPRVSSQTEGLPKSTQARHSEEVIEEEVIEEEVIEEEVIEEVTEEEEIEELIIEDEEEEEEEELFEEITKVNIKVIKRSNNIKRISTLKEREEERLKKAYQSLWGI